MLSKQRKLRHYINDNQKLVGLFVDADLNLINRISETLCLDIIQLHGNEDLNYINEIKKLKKAYNKAIPIKEVSDIKKAREYEKLCDMILFDTKSESDVGGGTGISFDWKLLKGYDSQREWIPGGLNEKMLSKALKITKATFIDVSSGVEKSRGEKCQKKIKSFIKYVKNYEK